MREEKISWRGLDEETRKKLVARCVSEVTGQYGNTIMESSSRNAYLARRVERITDRTVWALAEQLKKGDSSLRASRWSSRRRIIWKP